MNTILVFAFAVGVVSADVGLGYNYKVPHTSYGVPSYQVGSNSASNYNTVYNGASGSNAYVYKGQSGHQGLNAGQNSAYQGGYTGQSGHQGLNAGQNSAYQGGYTGQSGHQGLNAGQNSAYQGGYTGLTSGIGTGTGYQTSGNAYKTTSNTGFSSQYYTSPSSGVSTNYQSVGNGGQNGYQTYNQYQTQSQNQYQYQNQPAQVFKHFYVHAAPEEPEQVRPRNPIVLPAPQKHYKIIFIKTPVQVGAPAPIVPVQQQNEEKTIVYVLVKKPEEYQDIVLPKVEQKPPSKPEVYFIKYNSKSDSQAVINNIVNDYNSKGQSATFSNAGADFSSGSYSGQSTGSSGLISGVASTGFSELSNAGSGQIASSQTENQLLANLGSTFGQTSIGTSGNEQTNVGSTFNDESVGASSLASGQTSDNSASNTFTSVTSNQSTNTISTSQGIPHETYGVPKFKEE